MDEQFEEQEMGTRFLLIQMAIVGLVVVGLLRMRLQEVEEEVEEGVAHHHSSLVVKVVEVEVEHLQELVEEVEVEAVVEVVHQ